MAPNYGSPLDPAKAPPPPAPPVVPSPRAGTPVNPQQAPAVQTPQRSFVPVTLNNRLPPVNLPPGTGPRVVNFVTGADGMQVRSGMSVVGPSTLSSASSWGQGGASYLVAEHVTVKGLSTLVALSNRSFVWFNGSYWTGASAATESGGYLAEPPADFYDSTLFYEPTADENALAFCTGNDAVLTRAWQFLGPEWGSGKSISNITNSPFASRSVAYFDTRLVFANVMTSDGTRIPQRLTWSERGNPSIYTEPTGGTEDIVSMKGAITRLQEDGDRLIVFSEREIWAGTKAFFPVDLRFDPLDRTVGCPHPRTLQYTPLGSIFIGHDHNVYLLPKGGAQAVAIGTPIWPQLKDDLFVSSGLSRRSSFAVYDPFRGLYQLYTQNASGHSARGGYAFSLVDQTWSQLSAAHHMTAGCFASVTTLGFPATYLGTSKATVVALPSMESRSGLTQDVGSAISAFAIYPIGNPNPAQKLYVRDLLLDYSNRSCPSGSSLTIALSSDFGQSYDQQIGVALPFTQYSRQTVVNLGYSAVYPSIELRYESQASGTALRLQRLTAMTEGLGGPQMGTP